MMTEEEALRRAREAAIATKGTIAGCGMVRSGMRDSSPAVQAAKRALLDLDKPLPVDRDFEAVREIVAEYERACGAPATAGDIESGDYDDRLCAALSIFRKHIEARAKA